MSQPDLTLPPRLLKTLQSDHDLLGSVMQSVASVGAVLRWSQLPLSPDYTDHGLSHVEAALHSAEVLIDEGAWAVITPVDVAVLIWSTLLHDLGMHLSEDGYRSVLI